MQGTGFPVAGAIAAQIAGIVYPVALQNSIFLSS
jgi:hypothetical protein